MCPQRRARLPGRTQGARAGSGPASRQRPYQPEFALCQFFQDECGTQTETNKAFPPAFTPQRQNHRLNVKGFSGWE